MFALVPSGLVDLPISSYFFQCKQPDLRLVIIKRRTLYSFLGVFDLQVLYGTACVLGHDYEAAVFSEDRFVSFSAPFAISPPINVISSSTYASENFNSHRLKWRAAELIDGGLNDLMSKFECDDALVVLRFRLTAAAACAYDLYGASFFIPLQSIVRSTALNANCCVLEKPCPLFDEVIANHLQSVTTAVRKRREENMRTVIVVTGPKGVGKSTVVRAFINSIFKKNTHCTYLLDLDVGQSECSPPGCVSLFRITEPFTGVSFCNQKSTLLDSYFFGDISPAEDSSLYLKLISILLTKFTSTASASSTLVINTLGWVEGEGADLLDAIIGKANPDFVFNICSSTETNYSANNLRKQTAKNSTAVIVCRQSERPYWQSCVPFTLSPASRRDLLMIGYMASGLRLRTVSALPDIAPLAVHFRSISLLVHPSLGPISDPLILAAFNCSLVALCTVNLQEIEAKRHRRVFGDENLPGILVWDSAPLRCVGFGFVRATDPERRLFYVLTPVAKSSLMEVNSFVRGANIDMPETFLTQQRTRDAPYVICPDRDSLRSDMFKELVITTGMKRARSHKTSRAH